MVIFHSYVSLPEGTCHKSQVLGCRYGMEDSASNEAEETYKKWQQAGSIKRLDLQRYIPKSKVGEI